MELHRAHRPVDDPFFAPVRRRHPDVDVVLLPPPPPPARPGPAAEEAVAAASSRVATTAEGLWPVVAPDTAERPVGRLRFGDDPGSVRAEVRATVRRDDGSQALVRLRHELERQGWRVHRPEEGIERLTGRLDGLELSASYAEVSGTLVLTVTWPPVPVGVEAARRLVRGDR